LKPLYPQPQIDAVAHLSAWLTSSLGLEAADITTHRQIITDGSRSDPRKFPFDDINGFWARYWSHFGKEKSFVDSLAKGAEPLPHA
jgi:N-acetyl-anhydromuramyl-L-alanine amidase AmpD